MNETLLGVPVPRIDGPQKVTGTACYAADTRLPGMLYAVQVSSAIACGQVAAIDTQAAERAPGVRAVLTHDNAPRLPCRQQDPPPPVDPSTGHYHCPLQDARIRYPGQPLAVVIADTPPQAEHAATLVHITYAAEPPVLGLLEHLDQAKAAPDMDDVVRGDEGALERAERCIDQVYTIAPEHHNALEPHATVAVWDGDNLTLYDKSQWVNNVRRHVALAFGIGEECIRVISPFVGGAFGSALRAWPHVLLAAMAARVVGQPVKLALNREQLFAAIGHRPHTRQRVALGAGSDGRLAALVHEGWAETSVFEDYSEPLLQASRRLYACPNVITRYRLVELNINTPTPMRAPGQISGQYALECAMDELAYELGIDPVELRRRNHAEADPDSGKPWSSKSLLECYRVGAERIGWDRRTPQPRQMQNGRWLIGLGMASAMYHSERAPSQARAELHADGTARVQVAASDMGPGTYTALAQIAAATLELPLAQITVEIGDTNFPAAPVHGGSLTLASVGPAVQEACRALREQAQTLAAEQRLNSSDYGAIVRRLGRAVLAAEAGAKPGAAAKHYAMSAFGAHFVEVRVDPELGQIRVARIVSALAAGRILNLQTARSQALGGMVGGIGMALCEAGERDLRSGRVINPNLAEYLVPTCADVGELEPVFIPEHDPHVNPLGTKGLAELPICGVAAAIANAVFHATGQRSRDLPLRPAL